MTQRWRSIWCGSEVLWTGACGRSAACRTGTAEIWGVDAGRLLRKGGLAGFGNELGLCVVR